MRFTKFLIPILFIFLVACQENTKNLPLAPIAPPITKEVQPKVSIFTSDNVSFKKVSALEKYRDSLSYSIGMYLAKNFSKQNLNLKPTLFTQGYVDVIENQAGLSHEAAKNFISQVKNIQAYRAKADPGEYAFPLSLDSLSYALGADMGYQQKGTDYEMNPNSFHQGLVDFQTGVTSKVTEKQENNFMGLFFKGMKSVIRERNKGRTTVKMEEELAYFKKNRRTPGVVTMPSGLQYKIINTGMGPNAIYTDKLLVKFEGKSIDGEVLDSNLKRGIPSKILVSDMIAGWVEGLQMMNKGAKFRFFIPSNLAYGEDGNQNIPPSTPVIYEIEVVEIFKK